MKETTSEVAIIGSGVAGALAAYTLAKAGVKVILLDAGSEISRKETVKNFTESPFLDFSSGFPNDPSAPRPDLSSGKDNYIHYSDQALNIEYLKGVGGTTWHWSGTAMRLMPVDFKMKSSYAKGADWPFGYAEIEPYYTKAEYELGVAGDNNTDYGSPRTKDFPLPPFPPAYVESYIAEQLKELDVPFIPAPVARNSLPYDNRSQCQGYGTCSPICPSGALYNASVHVKKAVKSGAQLINHANVDKIIADQKGMILSLQVTRADNSQERIIADNFIVAANGIETPKLLLMSANDFFPTGLANNSGAVGKGLFGHPGVGCNMILPTPVYSGRGPDHALLCYKYRDGQFRKNHSAWTLSISNSSPLHSLHKITESALNQQLHPPTLDKVINHRFNHFARVGCMLEQLPDDRNTLSLDWKKTDSAGQPKININWATREYENKGITEAKNLLWNISQKLGAISAEMDSPVPHHHPMGATRMGLHPETSVADKNGKTHDHSNLYLISSSLFPTGGSANPTLTIAALSLMISDSLLKKIRKIKDDE